jgi:hypothetical protein
MFTMFTGGDHEPRLALAQVSAVRVVERASDFAAVTPLQGWGTGFVKRECPACGWQARTWQFTVVYERHAAMKGGRL